MTLGGEEAQEYQEHFSKVSLYGQGQFNSLLKKIEASNGYGPCHFDPITLDGTQIDRLRKQYSRGACR